MSTATLAAAIAAMAERPHEHEFYPALRRIDALSAGKPPLGRGRRPQDEAVRLGQDADLGFAPTSLGAVNPADRIGRPRVAVRFFGLFGPNGPLPLHLTAFARERVLHRGDETFVRFADLFHHRLLLLFYRAWAQAQPAVQLDRPEHDRFADWVGSLFGLGDDAGLDDGRVARALRHFGGLMSRQARNAEGLEGLLSGALGRPVRVEPFVGRWMRLPPAERSVLGLRTLARRDAAARLGHNVVAGAGVFDRQHHVRLHVGPLARAEFEALLPGGPALRTLVALVQHYVGEEFGWDVSLELAPGEAPPARLGRADGAAGGESGQGAHGAGGEPGGGTRLGWTSWLGRTDGPQRLRLQPPARRSPPSGRHA